MTILTVIWLLASISMLALAIYNSQEANFYYNQIPPSDPEISWFFPNEIELEQLGNHYSRLAAIFLSSFVAVFVLGNFLIPGLPLHKWAKKEAKP